MGNTDSSSQRWDMNVHTKFNGIPVAVETFHKCQPQLEIAGKVNSGY